MPADPVTTADVLIPFGAALLGAAVGGGGSALGSRWVHRGEITRQQRIRIYDELLPPMRRLVANRAALSADVPRPSTAGSLRDPELEVLRRAAAVAGRGDSAYVQEIFDLTATYREVSRDAAEPGISEDFDTTVGDLVISPEGRTLAGEMRAANARVLRKVDDLIDYLHRYLHRRI